MAKRALLIGSSVDGLKGVETDVQTMHDLLASYGFTSQLCAGATATRLGILQAYRQLIAQTVAGDVVVVYYSGHGARAARTPIDEVVVTREFSTRYYQFIVPVDIYESSDEDFRGITNLELSMLMAALTEKTQNVTAIFDCCHSATISRGFHDTARALPNVWYIGVESHLQLLENEGIDTSQLHVESNPYVVRLVAAGPSQAAFEYTNIRGQNIGILTESLKLVLHEANGMPIPWMALGDRIRERVLSLRKTQRPEVEGPIDRLLFDVKTVEQTGVLEAFNENGLPHLRGGRLLGVGVGDEYAILPLNSIAFEADEEIASGTVIRVSSGYSQIALTYRNGHDSLPKGARAFPKRRALYQLSLRLGKEARKMASLRSMVESTEYFRVLLDNDTTDVIATIEIKENKIVLLDTNRRLLIKAKPISDTAIYETRENLKQLAQAHHLRTLSSGQDEFMLRSSFEVDWGLAEAGKRRPLPKIGAVLTAGDSVYVRLHNSSSQTLYFAVFDIGLVNKVSLLTRSQPSGVEIEANGDYILGYRELKGLTGLSLEWPVVAPQDGPRLESLVVIIMNRPQNLHSFEQSGMRGDTLEPTSQLQRLLTQYANGGTRDISMDKNADISYAVEHIDFMLAPKV